jgi:PAS domain-containing protein
VPYGTDSSSLLFQAFHARLLSIDPSGIRDACGLRHLRNEVARRNLLAYLLRPEKLRMKGRVSIERIGTARERLAELSELSPASREHQVQQAVEFLSSFLDELEAAANSGDLERETDNESRFNILAETASDGIISIDDRSIIRYVNPAAEQMFGYQPGEMVDKSLTVLMP